MAPPNGSEKLERRIDALRLAKDGFLNAFMLHDGIDIGAANECDWNIF
jgi:hypothetical protein